MRSNTVFSQLLQLICRYRFKNPLYTFDSSLVNVCLSLFSWAMYRTKKGAFKLHTLLDHSSYLPSFLVISEGKTHDINVVKDDAYGFPELSPDSILLIDRAYIDFKWLYSLTVKKLFFVTKAKRNMKYKVIGQQNVPKNKGVISDYHIRLTNFYQRKTYPASLRLVTYVDLKFQTKCRHSLHELTRIVGELLLDNAYLIETLTITFDEYKRIKSLQTQLSFW